MGTFDVMGDEILLFECAAQCCSDLAGFVIVDLGKEVHVFGRPGDKAVHGHGSASSQCQRVSLRQGQRGSHDSLLQRIQARNVVTSGYLESDEPRLGAYVRRERLVLDGWAADLLERAE